MRILNLLLLISLLLPVGNAFSGFFNINATTDTSSRILFVPFDLRERESFLQVTNIGPTNQNYHIQIYNVGNLCNENNFFDDFTPNDTHVYNLRDILTNDGNPSGVDLPDDAYGIVVITAPLPEEEFIFLSLIGNIRIIDNLGYEYRTNAVAQPLIANPIISIEDPQIRFNYNSQSGVVLSDVFGIAASFNEPQLGEGNIFEAALDNVLDTWVAVDVDIINNNEVLFSCRDVVFACVDENNPLIEEILVLASGEATSSRSSASVARFEYGINDVIPNSKGGELLCPGNNIPEGIVILTIENTGQEVNNFYGFVGLNNGNGRGSFDSFFNTNIFFGNIF